MILKNSFYFAVIVIVIIIAWIALGWGMAHQYDRTPSSGYVTQCRAFRTSPYGVALTCKTEGGFPDWVIYINNTGGHEFTHLVENSYPFDHFPQGPPEYTVYVPCGNNSEITVYNNQLRGDRISLVFDKVV